MNSHDSNSKMLAGTGNNALNLLAALVLQAFWDYYDSHTLRSKNEVVVNFGACARILDGRHAVYTGKGPSVASYSSRGPDVNNALMQTADVLKPNILAPGTSIWSAWSPTSQSDQYNIGTNMIISSPPKIIIIFVFFFLKKFASIHLVFVNTQGRILPSYQEQAWPHPM